MMFFILCSKKVKSYIKSKDTGYHFPINFHYFLKNKGASQRLPLYPVSRFSLLGLLQGLIDHMIERLHDLAPPLLPIRPGHEGLAI